MCSRARSCSTVPARSTRYEASVPPPPLNPRYGRRPPLCLSLEGSGTAERKGRPYPAGAPSIHGYPMTWTLGRWRAAGALALAPPAPPRLGMGAGPAGATTPCPPMEYSVAYAAPVWSVTVLNDLPWRLDGMWYWSPWNGSYESLADHVDRPAGEVERVTLQDRDGSGNLSRSDEIQAWDGPRGLQMLQLAVGPNASALGMPGGIPPEDG